jgi:FkbM family methyltransferase
MASAVISPSLEKCPFARELDSSPLRAAVKDRLLHTAIPFARAYLRYTPFDRSRDYMWMNWIEPYLAWHSHAFEARTRFGPRIAGTTFDILPQHIYYFGVWEPVLTKWIEERLKPGDTFIDVGANVGYFSMLASVLVGPSGSVVAVEASPTICERLSRGLRRNRLANVRLVNAAASAEHGRQMVFLGPDSHTGLTATHAASHLTAEREVDAAPLSSLLTHEELGRARLIKIDVEGAEDAVIAGVAPALADASADLEIAIELHPGDHTGLFTTLERAGFHAYQLEIDYSPLRYRHLDTAPRPRRLREPVEGELDVIFSRREAETL